MRHSAHISIPIALLQVLVLIAGIVVIRLTFIPVKITDPMLDHPHFRIPVLIHHYGWLLLIIPLLWTGSVLWLENRPTAAWSRRCTVASGVMVLIALCWLLCHAWSKSPLRMLME